jgi:hypothetical protein
MTFTLVWILYSLYGIKEGQPMGIGVLEIEQGFCQGLELLQRQRLDLGGGGGREGAAAAVELTESDSCLSFLAPLGFAYAEALRL